VRRLLTGVDLDQAFGLDPMVSLRPEPFGALAYHFGTRRLSFLRSPDILAVVQVLGDHETVRAALEHCGIEPGRWPSFLSALSTLAESNMIQERVHVA